jgi:TolB protein
MAFISTAGNLVPGPTNHATQIYVENRPDLSTRRASVSRSGVEGNGPSGSPALAANGRFVAYHSAATNLAGTDTNNADDIYVSDLCTGAVRRASLGSAGPA